MKHKRPKLAQKPIDQQPVDEEDYAVEKVVDMRTCEVMGVQYLIRWVGYQSEDDTWVNEANVDAPEAVAQYLSLAC